MAANAINCNATRFGTGLPDCLADVKYSIGFFAVKKTWSVANTTTIDKAFIVDNIQNGNFVPFLQAFSFEPTTPEATTEESPNGVMSVVRNGLPTFNYLYERTIQFQKIAASYNSYSQYDIIMAFDNNRLFLADDGTNFKGFNGGMLNTNTFQFNDGSTAGKTPISLQLIDNAQFNNGSVVALDFNINSDIEGVFDVLLTDGVSATGGDVTVKAVFKANPAVFVSGLGVDQFSLVIDGSREAVTAVSYNDATGVYTLTPTSTTTGGQSVVVELYDTVNALSIAKLDDQLYDGISDAIITA